MPREPTPQTDPSSLSPLRQADVAPLDEADFQDKFAEPLAAVIDVNTWRTGGDLLQEYERIVQEVSEAVKDETELQNRIRDELYSKLPHITPAHVDGGVFQADMKVIKRIHKGLLFNGGVEACDGTVQVHDTLPLTVFQVGVSLVSYRGDKGTWHQRLFRRDLRLKGGDPVEEALKVLEQRSQRAAINHTTPGDQLNHMGRKTIMDYAERAILLHRAKAVWRMGHGNPVTYELLTGAGILNLMVASTRVLRELIEGHQKFVFVASEPRERVLLTIGQALRPMEYAVVDTLDTILDRWFHQHRFAVDTPKDLTWDDEPIDPTEWIPRFIKDVASQVAVGVYRATVTAPAQLFYAHVDHVHTAAHIVLADSMLQTQRGFPLLIDLADHVCRHVFGGSLDHLTESAYAAAGAPFRYLSERNTR